MITKAYDCYFKKKTVDPEFVKCLSFLTLLEPKVVTKDEQTPLKITQMDFKVDLETTTDKKVIEILNLLMELGDHLKIQKDKQCIKIMMWTTFLN